MTHRVRLATVALMAIAACLALVATAGAEIRNGEFTAAVDPSLEPELDVTNAKVSYETVTGAVNWAITTAEPPVDPEWRAMTALYVATGECNLAAIQAGGFTFPLLEISAVYEEPKPETVLYTSPASTENLGPAANSVTGATTHLSATYPALANRGFNCASFFLEGSPHYFQVGDPVVPPVSPTPTPSQSPPAPGPVAPTAPAPAKLTIVKPKPAKLAVGKWTTVSVKVTNIGGTGTAQGSFRMAAASGINVKPAKQKLPALGPGASWVESVRVQITDKAKHRSTLQVTGTASGLTAKSSLIVKSTD